MIAEYAQAQRRIKLEPGSEQLIGFREDGINYTSVKGNVKFTHRGTVFYCDSAVLAKKTNYLEAYGNVRIIDDSVTITSQMLKYDGDTRIAKLRQKVVLTKLGQLQIFTDYLDYDRNTGIANYFNDGKIVDSTNVLTSRKGYYNSVSNFASFKTDVVSTNEDYVLNSDTLVYNTKSGVIFFVDRTTLTDQEGSVFVYEAGKYNSRAKRSDFSEGRVETEDYFLAGKEMRLDDIRGIYNLKREVTMYGKINNVIITGHAADHDRRNDITKIYDSPLMKLVAEGDTLFVSADTLISLDSPDPAKKRLLAYSNVKFYKTDIQGVADSLAYMVADSALNLYGKPVLWSDQNQMTADSIAMLIEQSTLKQMDMKNNAFVITQDTAGNYNQIKGRGMEASFDGDQLSEVYVSGNGESIFFMYDEEKGILMGMNKIICSNIRLYFENQKLIDAAFLVNPEGDFIPPHRLKDDDKLLNGFIWRGSERPSKAEVVGESPKATLPETLTGELKVPEKKLNRLRQ